MGLEPSVKLSIRFKDTESVALFPERIQEIFFGVGKQPDI